MRNIYKKSDRFFLIGNALNMPISDKAKKVNGIIKIQDISRNLAGSAKGK